MDKAKKIRLGLFITVSVAIFILAFFYIGSKQNLFTKTFDVYGIFKSVNGLTPGNNVLFAGIKVGTVQSVEIISSDKVKVNLNIAEKYREFIKKDSEATINSDGLVGNKILSISSGTPVSPPVENGDMLQTVKPLEIGDILNNLNESTKQAQIISKEISEIVTKVNQGSGTLGKLVNESNIYDHLDSLMTSFGSSTANINNILSKASGTINIVAEDILTLRSSIKLITDNIADITTKINSSHSLIGTLLTDTVFANNIKGVMKNANQTTANLELGSFSFYQNMEALKHNFLFKGYFEDIGYWDKSNEEKRYISREEKILNKEHELNQRELQLKEFQMKLDSLRNSLQIKIDKIKESDK